MMREWIIQALLSTSKIFEKINVNSRIIIKIRNGTRVGGVFYNKLRKLKQF